MGANDPKSYVAAKNLHAHAPMTGGEIAFNYNDFLLNRWAKQTKKTIGQYNISPAETWGGYINKVPLPVYPSGDVVLSSDDSRCGHPDNPKYKFEYFDAYNTHSHTPFEGGNLIWNSSQWARKLNAELNLYKRLVPSGVWEGVAKKMGFSPDNTKPIEEPVEDAAIPYNRHSHSHVEGGIIAQNKWMQKAIENQKIHEYKQNQSLTDKFMDGLKVDYVDNEFPVDEAIFGESQKAGTGASGILDIEDPLPLNFEGYFINPAITAPGFGTEVVFNDKQLKLVLNKLIQLGLIRKPGGGQFNIPDTPTRSYNVHKHTSEFDGGLIERIPAHSHAGVGGTPGENLAYGCFAPFVKKDNPESWALYQAVHPS